MASIDFPNAPTNFSMLDFRGLSNMYGNYAKSARFAVHIKPSGYMTRYYDFTRQLVYLCEAADMPGRSFVNVDVRYYGPSQKLPIQSQYDDINLTFLCRNKSYEREFFDNWQLIINPINTFDFNYRDDYACEIDIYQYSDVGFDDQHTPEYCITLMDAYPVQVNGQPMSWQDDMFQRLVVNFTFTRWKRRGLDPEPRGGEPPNFSFNLVNGNFEGRPVTVTRR